jgi:hypothetical protein
MVGVWWDGHVYNIPKVVSVTHVNWPSERAPKWLSFHHIDRWGKTNLNERSNVNVVNLYWKLYLSCRVQQFVTHTTAAGPGKSTTTTTDFPFFTFFLAGTPFLYKSVLFAGLMVCVSCSPILQQHHRSRSHQSVCIIRKSAGSLWDLNLFLFIFCTLGRTFCIYFGFWEVKYLGNIYQDERVAAGRMVNAYRRSCCGYLVAVYSGATFPAPAGI